MSMQPLSEDAIAAELMGLSGWRRDGSEIVRTYDRSDFNGSIAFVNAVAAEANAADHHPDLLIAWSTVTVRLSTHDANGLTARDFRLAHAIDRLAR